jgi:hypothetical protein
VSDVVMHPVVRELLGDLQQTPEGMLLDDVHFAAWQKRFREPMTADRETIATHLVAIALRLTKETAAKKTLIQLAELTILLVGNEEGAALLEKAGFESKAARRLVSQTNPAGLASGLAAPGVKAAKRR